MKILIEIFWQKLIVSNVISAFLDHLKHKFFFAGQPWWLTWSAPLFKKSGSTHDNIFVQIQCSYFWYTSRLFLGCAIFVARCNTIRASWETKKERLSYTKSDLCEGHHIFECTSSFLCYFFCFLLLLPAGVKVTYLLNGPYKDT